MATVRVETLIDAAVRAGVIENTEAGKAAYADWLTRDPKAAQAALIPALRQSQATAPVQATMKPTTWKGDRFYPANWHKIVKSASRPNGVTRGPARSAQAQIKGEALPSPQKTFAAAQRQRELDEVAATLAIQQRNAVAIGTHR